MADKKLFDALSFGEIMLRLSPPNKERLSRGEVFEKCAGGSELNVVAGIAQLGLRTGIISKLPQNEIGSFIKDQIRFCSVSDDYLIYDSEKDSRVGIYYYEYGAYPRKPCVVYDRKGSSVNSISLSEIPARAYANTRLFHTSGITLALSGNTRGAAIEMIRQFKANGALISFDVNYRANLWSEEEAKATIEQILPLTDILFISEETSRRMFGKTGELRDIMKSYCTDFGVSVVATTERRVINPSEHTFGSVIYSAENDTFYTEPPYKKIQVVDRIGSGDAYVSGVLFGILQYGDYQKALEFGNATSSVKNTVAGDLPQTNLREITRIVAAHKSTGVQSEMDR